MKYASEIIGMPVVSFATGQQVEKVRDVVYNEDTNTLLALLVDEGGWLHSARIIPFDSIKSIGEDAVVIASDAMIITVDQDPRVASAAASNKSVKGNKVLTEDGKDLGRIDDLCIDEANGRVESYQVSGGLFADMYKGKVMVPAPTTLKVGEDVVFVPNETVQLVEEQNGGLKGAAQNAGDSLSMVGATAGDKFDQAKNVATSDHAHAKMDDFRETVQANVDDFKGKLAEAWEGTKAKSAELKGQADAKVEENRINGALGKPANRVVLDKQDNVILNVGDIITHKAVEQASAAGELDVLLNAVYAKDPELATEDMKAKQPEPSDGTAAAHV
jgi:uncharacterized protein YrrD